MFRAAATATDCLQTRAWVECASGRAHGFKAGGFVPFVAGVCVRMLAARDGVRAAAAAAAAAAVEWRPTAHRALVK